MYNPAYLILKLSVLPTSAISVELQVMANDTQKHPKKLKTLELFSQLVISKKLLPNQPGRRIYCKNEQ